MILDTGATALSPDVSTCRAPHTLPRGFLRASLLLQLQPVACPPSSLVSPRSLPCRLHHPAFVSLVSSTHPRQALSLLLLPPTWPPTR